MEILVFQAMQGGLRRAMDSCRLSAVVCRKEYILHVTRKGNSYGSMSLPSVTRASHVHTDKRTARLPRRQQGPSLLLSLRLVGECRAPYHQALLE